MLIAVAVLAVSAQSITDNSTADGDNSGTWDNDTGDAPIDGTEYLT